MMGHFDTARRIAFLLTLGLRAKTSRLRCPMSDRVLVLVPGLGALALTPDVYRQALAEGAALIQRRAHLAQHGRANPRNRCWWMRETIGRAHLRRRRAG